MRRGSRDAVTTEARSSPTPEGEGIKCRAADGPWRALVSKPAWRAEEASTRPRRGHALKIIVNRNYILLKIFKSEAPIIFRSLSLFMIHEIIVDQTC